MYCEENKRTLDSTKQKILNLNKQFKGCGFQRFCMHCKENKCTPNSNEEQSSTHHATHLQVSKEQGFGSVTFKLDNPPKFNTI